MAAERRDDADDALASATKALAQPGLSQQDIATLHGIRAFALLLRGEDAEDDMGAAPEQKAFFAHGHASRGNRLLAAQSWDEAVASYTKALGFDPRRKSAFVGRGIAELANTDTDAALADFDRALALGATSDIYRHRGEAREQALDFEGAVADYSASIRLDPQGDAWGLRGRVQAVLGRTDMARGDLEHAIAMRPRSTIDQVWLHIVHLRLKQDDRAWLAGAAGRLDLGEWPGPALAYFAGQIPADDMTQIALKSASTAKWHQRCDAWFYLGEEAAARGDDARARDLFRQTVSRCNALDFEWDAAKMELKRLGA
ncbi:MAG TPA: tetratricopeptide repeat protein [Rhizomicrobium sp.]|jgi:lipoprotein NlpI